LPSSAGGRLLPGRARRSGARTGVAIRAGDALPTIADRAQLATSLLAAPRSTFDTVRSTAGIHVAKVLQRLGFQRGRAAPVDVSERRDGDRALAATTASGAMDLRRSRKSCTRRASRSSARY
jgi:hypothetical protein